MNTRGEVTNRRDAQGLAYGVPEVVERNIRKQATRVASKARRLDLVEDLAQEARIRAWQEAAAGETKPQYLLARTRQAISDVMRAGTDVDGRPWPAYERSKVYQIWSMDYVIEEEPYTTHGETILDDKFSVEQQALGLVFLAEIHWLLTGEERLILEQCLEGYYQREIAENLQLGDRYVVRRRMRHIREKAARYLRGGQRVSSEMDQISEPTYPSGA